MAVSNSGSRTRLTAVTTPYDAQIVDALDAGVLVVRGDGRIVRANPCAGRFLGALHVDLVGSNVADVIAPLSTLLTAPGEQGGAEHRGEVDIVRADGTKATIGLSVTAFLDDAAGVHHVILFRDISGWLELRRQRDKLLKMAALGDVLPSVLHELRNPVAAVTSMLELMVEETTGDLQNDLHAMLWEVRRMNLNLQGIGGFARPVSAATTHVAVDHAIREACRILDPTAERKAVKIVCHVDDMPLLRLDRSVVSGVVFNLVTNAIDACNTNDVVAVSASLPEKDVFELVVKDSGAGMTPEVLGRCCELFFTQKDGGSGIGLALCREAATSSGGTLDVESTPGAGTRVTMRIPLGTQDTKQETRR
jgi:PAS domain S-box-containing protein